MWLMESLATTMVFTRLPLWVISGQQTTVYLHRCGKKTKPYAAVHFGGQLAAPVFKEIADRLYTLYVNDNMLFTQATRNDSINYFYTGFKPDVKQFMNAVSVPYKDSSLKNADWISVSKGSNSAVAKTILLQ